VDGRHRAALLFHLVEAHVAEKRSAEATAVYRRLLADHPYDEMAARAKDRWSRTLGR
jgi:hypothetical protein